MKLETLYNIAQITAGWSILLSNEAVNDDLSHQRGNLVISLERES